MTMKLILNKVAIILIAAFLLLMNVPPKSYLNDDVTDENVQAATTPSKPTGSSEMYPIKVVGIEPEEVNPAVYWYQQDDLNFVAEINDGATKVPAKNATANGKVLNEPVTTRINDKVDLTKYPMPASYRPVDSEKDGKQEFQKTAVKEFHLKNNPADVQFLAQSEKKKSFTGISVTVEDNRFVNILTETGNPHNTTTKIQYGKNFSNQPKYVVRYDTPLLVNWYGTVEMRAEIRVIEDSKMTVGQTKLFKLELRTKEGELPWTSWQAVTAATWSSDKSAVATVSASGTVTAKGKGQAKISATWIKEGRYHLVASATVEVTAEDTIGIDGKTNVCFKDGSTQLTATLYKADGTKVNVTNLTATKWISSKTAITI